MRNSELSLRRLPLPVVLTVVVLALLGGALPPAFAGAGSAIVPLLGSASERDPAVPALEKLLGFPLAERSATYEEIGRALAAWSANPRARLGEHGTTWEGRALRHLIVSSPENLARLDEIRATWERIASDDTLAPAEAEALARSTPAVAWLAFSIHGDEVSGADAALQIVDHLLSSRSADVAAMLRDLVVILDPIQNPDGRERYLARIRETAGGVPVLDGQSALQQGSWPWGRTNHYLFDMNRDWVFATQPETRGRIAALASWRPLLFLDVHEMGTESPFLFYPPRPPFNPYLPQPAVRWWERFGRDEAAAFDRHGWRYYTGEWADWWFPGYSDSFGTLRGAIGILHEQGGVATGQVRLANGQTIGYPESVSHQVVAAWSTLRTLAANREAIAVDFAKERRRLRATDGPLAGRTLVVRPDGNRSRLAAFVDTVRRLGGRIERLERAARAEARDPLGRKRPLDLPPGTLLVRGRQPEGALLRATLDFDLPLPQEVLAKERAAIVAGRDTLLYDISGWSLPLLFGLDAYEVDGELPGVATNAIERLDSPAAPSTAAGSAHGEVVAWAVDGASDGSVALAARLLQEGYRLRLAERPFELAGTRFVRGSILALRDDNRARAAELSAAFESAALAAEVAAVPLATGYGESELPDLGGQYFLPLERPRVGLVGYGSADTTSFGALWLELDRRLGLATTLLAVADLRSSDLRRYNVLVLAGGLALEERDFAKLKTWTEAGGTLVALEASAIALAQEKSGVLGARSLSESAEELAAFRDDLVASWHDSLAAGRSGSIARALAVTVEAATPLAKGELPEPPKKDEHARREARAAKFRPLGTLLAGRVDSEHWLTVGTGEMLPIFSAGSSVLLARSPAEAPVRYGVLQPRASAPTGQKAPAPTAEAAWRPLGWSAVPPANDLALRLSGLLWPEAAERLANSAYLVREAVGSGQVILFAGDPVWRGAALGTARLFGNAVVYGPGAGARPALLP